MQITQYPRTKLGTEPIKIKYSEWSCGVLVSAITVRDERIWAEALEEIDYTELFLKDSPRWDISMKKWIPW